MHLHLDFETRSYLDIKKVGLDNYTRAAVPVLMAWALDDGPVSVEQGAEIPRRLAAFAADPRITLCAWNSAFEQNVCYHALDLEVPDYRWFDPSVIARYCSLPARLGECGEALGLDETEAKQKSAGTRLKNKFSKPRTNGTFRDHSSDPQDWELFAEYCRRDVMAERAIFQRLKTFVLPEREQEVYVLDRKINLRGLPVSTSFIHAAKSRAMRERHNLEYELKKLTGLENPNSVQQLLPWLRERGYTYQSLAAPKVRAALTEIQ